MRLMYLCERLMLYSRGRDLSFASTMAGLRRHAISFFYWSGGLRVLHSFPTRRSSDLRRGELPRDGLAPVVDGGLEAHRGGVGADRKSTRLNSSHVAISYAVFCLKKKTHR